MNEAKLKTELKEALEKVGCVAIKLPDMARGVNKEGDLVCGIFGKFVLLETKLRKTGKPLSPEEWKPNKIVVTHKDLRESQFQSLSKVECRDCYAFVVAALYDQGDYRRIAWAIPYSLFCLRERWSIDNCRSDSIVIELTWQKGKGWDVSELLNEIKLVL